MTQEEELSSRVTLCRSLGLLCSYLTRKLAMKKYLTLLLLILFLGAGITVYLVHQRQEIRQRAASSATVTVSNTAMGTTQTQLSTNIVTWGSDFTQIPN